MMNQALEPDSMNSRSDMTYRNCQYGSHLFLSVMFLVAVLVEFIGGSGGARARSAIAPSPGDSVPRVGPIDFVIRDIYAPEEIETSKGLLRFLRRGMNAVHMETRRYVLRRELLFHPGEPLDPDLLAETERNLRELGYLCNVAVVPLDTLPEGTVPVQVRVQEAWSLSTNFSYSRSSEGSQRWNVLLSDDNFMGHGIQVSGGLGETEDYRFHQFQFRKRRLWGTRWQLGFGLADQGDGHAESVSLRQPFYALDDPWSLETSIWRDLADRRYYLSNAGPAGLDPSRDASLYVVLPITNEGLSLAFARRFSDVRADRIWRVGLGLDVRYLDVDFDEPDIELSDGRRVDFVRLAAGDGALAREEGSAVYPYLSVESQGRRWTKTRYLMRYGSVEDVPLDPAFRARCGPSGPFFGGTNTDGDRLLLDFSLSDWSRLGDGFLLLESEGFASLGASSTRAAAVSGLAGWIGHHGGSGLQRQTRLFGEAGWGERLLGTEAFQLGLNRGLRTLDFDGMAGDRLVRWNAEHNVVLPLEVLGFYRFGIAAFYDGGMAWWRGEDRGSDDLHHELGFGIRLGSTRSARAEVARIDVTWPLDRTGGPELTAVTRGLF
jgi:hypothetical protein